MKSIGDLIWPWPTENDVGLIIDASRDKPIRLVVYSDGEFFEVPIEQTKTVVAKSAIDEYNTTTGKNKVINENRIGN